MFLTGSPKQTNKYVIYGEYGVQSHIIMNEYGVSFTCNPLLTDNKRVQIFDNKEDALNAQIKNTFYNRIAEVQLILAVSAFELSL